MVGIQVGAAEFGADRIKLEPEFNSIRFVKIKRAKSSWAQASKMLDKTKALFGIREKKGK